MDKGGLNHEYNEINTVMSKPRAKAWELNQGFSNIQSFGRRIMCFMGDWDRVIKTRRMPETGVTPGKKKKKSF